MRLEDLSPEVMEKLEAYHALLLKWQKAINLVSPATLEQAWERHFADSAQLLPVILSASEGSGCSQEKDPSASLRSAQDDKIVLADLGSGAGFPGLVLAMLRPDLDVHLIESDTRKCEFLKNVSRETSTPVTVHNERIEKILPDLSPDLITARALASLTEILDYAWPCAEKNPALSLLLLKGKKAEEEIAQAQGSYAFEIARNISKTEPEGQILLVSNITKLPAQA